MRRAISFGFVLAFLSGAFAACTLDFDQFQATGGNGTGGTGAGGGTGGTSACTAACCTALDCPAPQDPCKRATCIAATCGEEARADGTAIDAQTTGDCKKAVCQGGAVGSVNDDGDTLDDGNECTIDACSNGSPTAPPAGPGTPCTSAGGKVCDGAGNCVECTKDEDCDGASMVCNLGSHTCVAITCSDNMQNGNETDKDCGGGMCPGCDTGQNCDQDTDCKSVNCQPNGNCAAPQCDDSILNGDETDVDCGGPDCDKCGPNEGCNVDSDCQGDACTGMGGTCIPNCNDNVMNGAETDTDCGGGTCGKCTIGQDCAGSGANCLSGYCDANDKCAMKSPDGTMCMGDAQCNSGHCTDGVCCDFTCAGTCRACNLPGDVGNCTDIPAGQDPANECGGADVCDGNGGCGKPLGATCAASGDCASNHCADTVCCDATCNGTCESCNLAGSMGACTPIPSGQDPANECAGSLNCNGNGACLKANGTACAGAAECQSGFCADNVCCDVACGAGVLCKACNLAASMGTCSNIGAGLDPANECNGNQTCDGNGACQP